VSTASIKSLDRKKDNEQERTEASAETFAPDASEISPIMWRMASLIILAGAAFIRLYELGLKPMHHDEGVNGFFLTNLFRKGIYHYDPNNYHGPTLYYFALVITKINGLIFGEQAGLSTIAVRLVPVIFGVGTVWLILSLRRNIGTTGALLAAAFVALSPGHVFISRYFIHEAHFVFFTLGIVVAAIRYYETADPLYLILASLSAALLFATKETAIISAGVLLLSLGVAEIYTRLFNRGAIVHWENKSLSKRKAKRLGMRREEPLERFGGVSNIALWSSIALLLFVFVNVLFYSSFFTYWQGVSGALESVQVWAKTGTKEHTHPFFTYFIWLWQEEAPLLIMGATGALLALIRCCNRFAIFTGAWAFGLLLAYSLIPYKTPWLMINFTVPLAIAGGYAINEIYNFAKDLKLHFVPVALAAAALVVLGIQAVSLNFYHYDDDSYPYVYAHTRREFLAMVEDIENLSNRAGTGKQTSITITSPDYWPLPWYLRDYERAGFFGHMTTTDEPLVLGSIDQVPELDAMLGDRYQKINAYSLRPGVTLVLYAKKELAGP
jgi:uncharacterized protein (TIGR03663 family)